MFILGSCKALNLSYSGCCVSDLSLNCKNEECFCDYNCYSNKDCCSDITDIGCYLKNKTLGKTKLDDHTIH